ncbi:MAG: hypothetical protein LBV23_09145 [Deltaproteobacteria bacterium]|nr:hypothetical protein [Deltaproteobacteria bacterium]
MKTILATILSFTVLGGVVYLYYIWQVTRFSLRRASSACVEREAIPREVRCRLDEAESFLNRNGFVYVGSFSMIPMLVLPGQSDTFWDNYYSEKTGILASVFSIPPGAPCTLSYMSCFKGGETWETINRNAHQMLGPHKWSIFDDYLQNEQEVLYAHINRLRDSGQLPVLDLENVQSRVWNNFISTVDYWTEQRIMKQAGEYWHFTWRGAFQLVARIRKGKKRLRRLPPFSNLTE